MLADFTRPTMLLKPINTLMFYDLVVISDNQDLPKVRNRRKYLIRTFSKNIQFINCMT